MAGKTLYLALVAASAFAAACADEAEAPVVTSSPSSTTTASTPTPVETANPTPTELTMSGTPPDGFAVFREFAAEIEAAIESQDESFFLSRAQRVEITCQGDEGLGQCGDMAAGSILRGIPGSAWMSDAYYVFSDAEYSDNLQSYFEAPIESSSDQYGGGDLRLYALASKSAGEVSQFLAITSAILDIYPSTGHEIGREEREAHVFKFQSDADGWSFVGEIAAGLSPAPYNWLSGMCPQCYDYFELWQGATN